MKTKLLSCICAFSLYASSTIVYAENIDYPPENSSIHSEEEGLQTYHPSTFSDVLEQMNILFLPEPAEEEFTGRYAFRQDSYSSDLSPEYETMTVEELSELCMEYLPAPLKEEELLKKLPYTVQLDIPEIKQNPELPTGCESVALTIALQYKGFELEKETIADDYLIQSPSSNFIIGYVGNPHSDAGMGIYPPGLLLTADRFFKEQNVEKEIIRNLTGTSLTDLFSIIATGEPVIIWATMYMSEPQYAGYSATLDELEYQWYYSEHCMVLAGYNLKENTVTISDPLEGIVTRNFDEFNNLFEKTGKISAIV